MASGSTAPSATAPTGNAKPKIFVTAPVVTATGQRRVPEPLDIVVRDAYSHHLMIPVGYSNQIFAMSGPLYPSIAEAMKIKSYFPVVEKLKPVACAKKDAEDNEDPAHEKIDLRFFNRGVRAFRSCPNLDRKSVV